MRFHISGDRCPQEVIGEVIEGSLPNAGDEVFAVHHNILPREGVEDQEFSVSHVETGFRIASGETIDHAIAAAKAKMLAKGPDEFLNKLARARRIIAERRSA